MSLSDKKEKSGISLKVNFLSISLIWGIFFALVQQGIVAGSIFIIAELSKSIVSGEGFLFWLCLYAVSLTVVYVPTTLTNFFFNQAKFISFERYVYSFAKYAFGEVGHFYCKSSKEKREAYFTHEAWLIIDEDYEMIKEFSHLIFNIILSVAVLSHLIHSSLIIAYAISIPLTLICVLKIKPMIERLSDSTQKSRSGLMKAQGRGWDTILTGNAYNLSVWQCDFKKRCTEAGKAKKRLDMMIDISAFVIVVISAIPVISVIGFSYYKAREEVATVALLIATTSRQLGTIQYLSEVINMFVTLSDKVRRTGQLSNTLCLKKAEITKGRIDWKDIRLKVGDRTIRVADYNDFYKNVNGFSTGRYTITGDNGSGKTTILAEIKTKLQERAYLLPNNSNMVFECDIRNKEASSGQRVTSKLLELSKQLEKEKVEVILLDEWNANLDNHNTEKINDILSNLSKKYCVIEVLHR